MRYPKTKILTIPKLSNKDRTFFGADLISALRHWFLYLSKDLKANVGASIAEQSCCLVQMERIKGEDAFA